MLSLKICTYQECIRVPLHVHNMHFNLLRTDRAHASRRAALSPMRSTPRVSSWASVRSLTVLGQTYKMSIVTIDPVNRVTVIITMFKQCLTRVVMTLCNSQELIVYIMWKMSVESNMTFDCLLQPQQYSTHILDLSDTLIHNYMIM